nr:ATP-binding protein [Tumebacillus amylolyticus]
MKIEGFRGIRDLRIEGLGSVNLIVGGNNAGKTSVLEAIELVCNPISIAKFVETSRGRDRAISNFRVPLETSVEWMFPVSRSQDQNEGSMGRELIQLEASIHGVRHSYVTSCVETKIIKTYENALEPYDQTESRALEITLRHFYMALVEVEEKISFLTSELPRGLRTNGKDIVPSRMVTPVDHRMLPIEAKSLTQTFQSDKKGLIYLLQMFDSDIMGIELLAPDGVSAIPFIQHRYKSYVPVSVYGDGMRRVLTLASAVIQANHGVLLIDEVETALHHRNLSKVFSWLVEACSLFDVQLFVSTHSLEAIDAIVDTFIDVDLETENVSLERLDRIVGYRLVQQTNQTIAKRFAGKDLYSLRHEFGQDVR